jgi:peptidoglycan/xylan/chitin deacetylase (PgdA/CDA1 family)
MRKALSIAALLLAGVWATAADPAAAQQTSEAGQPAVAGAAPALPACAARPDVLGVSRVVEIDTKGGPRFGLMQYKDLDFLEDGEVVLTFDDGPLRPYTKPILDALDVHCTRATFFVVGRMAVADPDMVREMARRGHTVGTHTWSHRNLRSSAPVQAKGEVELGVSIAARVLQPAPLAPFFRFPYLSDPKGMIAHVQGRDMGIFSIDVDSRDFRTRNPAEVQRTVLSQLAARRKGIILFHDIQPSTAGALRNLLGELKQRGFKVVHLVPKGTVTTLPEYDAMAERELSRKLLAAARDPLATRSVVWPVARGTEAPVASAARAQPSRAGGPPPPPAPATPEVLPWANKTTATPAPRREDDDNWSTRMFQNN